MDFALPNGLARDQDGLIYVPSTLTGEIRVYTLNEHHTLDQVSSIQNPLPIDNIAVDRDGDLYCASIPKIYIWGESSKRPFEVDPPSTVFRIRKAGKGGKKGGKRGTGGAGEIGEEGWEIRKIMEDDSGTLPGATIAVHDVETGRVFLGGAMSPFITICETR
jgi:arylesterase / paraoxonase